MTRRTSPRKSERGQVLIVVALLIPVLLGMAALAIDIGTYASERRDMQNDADSIALAGAQGLPDSAAVTSLANEWAGKNGIDLSEMTLSIYGGTTAPTVRVTLNRPHEFSFIRALGISQKDVGAIAAAQKLSVAGGAGIVPWSITQDTVDAAASGALVTIKYDSNGNYGQGNFGAIRIAGNGASDYEDSAKYGADSVICASGTPNCTTSGCPGTYPTTCAENAPECDGDQCQPKTGNMTGPTRDAVDFRMNNTDTGCDTFGEAFTPLSVASNLSEELEKYVYAGPGAGGAGSGFGARYPQKQPTNTPTNTPTKTNTDADLHADAHEYACSHQHAASTHRDEHARWSDEYAAASDKHADAGIGRWRFDLRPQPGVQPVVRRGCAPKPSSAPCSRRVFLIPIVDGFGNGSSDPVTILGFALVYLEGYDGSCTGNSCDVEARFIRADVTTGGLTGAYDPDAALHVVKLTE